MKNNNYFGMQETLYDRYWPKADTWLKTYGDAKDVILGVEAAGN